MKVRAMSESEVQRLMKEHVSGAGTEANLLSEASNLKDRHLLGYNINCSDKLILDRSDKDSMATAYYRWSFG